MSTQAFTELIGVPYVVYGTPRAAFNKQVAAEPIQLLNIYYGGRGRVYGTVKIKGAPDYPVSRRVRLFRDRDAKCVGEVWSDATTGEYEFNYLDPNERYTALAYDHLANYRAVVADNLTAESP